MWINTGFTTNFQSWKKLADSVKLLHDFDEIQR
jgi:hypothetical protein